MAAPPLLLGVDIGATKTLLTVRPKVGAGAGWRVGSGVIRAPTVRDPDGLSDLIAEGSRRLAHEHGGRIVAVGIAAPGPLDIDTGVVTRSSNLGWLDVPLAAMVQRRLGLPVALEDDAKAAALGEWSFGAGDGCGSFVYVTISSGVGSGIIIDGQVLRGASGNAGEIGHLLVDRDGPRCGCGRRGDVESYLGGTALARRARAAWPQVRRSDGTATPRSAAEVFAAARAGDGIALALVEDAIVALAGAISAIVATIEPDRIAIGGALGLAQRGFVRRAVAAARRNVLRESGRALTVVPAALGDESVLAGAVTLAGRLLE